MVGCVLGSIYKLLNQVRDRGISVPKHRYFKNTSLLQLDFKFGF